MAPLWRGPFYSAFAYQEFWYSGQLERKITQACACPSFSPAVAMMDVRYVPPSLPPSFSGFPSTPLVLIGTKPNSKPPKLCLLDTKRWSIVLLHWLLLPYLRMRKYALPPPGDSFHFRSVIEPIETPAVQWLYWLWFRNVLSTSQWGILLFYNKQPGKKWCLSLSAVLET